MFIVVLEKSPLVSGFIEDPDLPPDLEGLCGMSHTIQVGDGVIKFSWANKFNLVYQAIEQASDLGRAPPVASFLGGRMVTFSMGPFDPLYLKLSLPSEWKLLSVTRVASGTLFFKDLERALARRGGVKRFWSGNRVDQLMRVL